LLPKEDVTNLLHLAWEAGHRKYWTSPLNLRWPEVTTRPADAFSAAGGQQIVIAGTFAICEWTHGYCREASTPLNLATLYGTAKDATRRMVAAVCDQKQIQRNTKVTHVELFEQGHNYLVILPWNIAAEVKQQNARLAELGTKFVTAVPQL
jgi:hypothetical protein